MPCSCGTALLAGTGTSPLASCRPAPPSPRQHARPRTWQQTVAIMSPAWCARQAALSANRNSKSSRFCFMICVSAANPQLAGTLTRAPVYRSLACQSSRALAVLWRQPLVPGWMTDTDGDSFLSAMQAVLCRTTSSPEHVCGVSSSCAWRWWGPTGKPISRTRFGLLRLTSVASVGHKSRALCAGRDHCHAEQERERPSLLRNGGLSSRSSSERGCRTLPAAPPALLLSSTKL